MTHGGIVIDDRETIVQIESTLSLLFELAEVHGQWNFTVDILVLEDLLDSDVAVAD